MSVHCQRLALLNQRSDGEYFAELNVMRYEFPVKPRIQTVDRWLLFADSLGVIVE